MKNNLQGRRALVTGASAGIGRATALLLASQGCEVWAAARRKEKLADLQSLSPRIHPLVLDVVSDYSELEKALEGLDFDILVNNAGLAKGRGRFDESQPEHWQAMFDTNVLGLLKVSHLVIQRMLKRGERAEVVNIGSIAGLFTYAGGSVYCATKFAVHALSEAWRQDFLGTPLRFCEICPGMVETEFSLVRFGDEKKAKAVYEGMRPLTADDIAEAVLWALQRPDHVSIQKLVIMPTDQASVGLVHRRGQKA